MEYPKHPFGVNMAFRRRVFERIGVFDPRLGRVGGTLLSGEETDLFRRVHLAGFRTLYVPSAVLHHRIAPSRATPDWVLERSYWQGVTEVVLRQLYDPMSRFALLRLALRDLRWLVRHHAGGHLQPRAIYWHHRGLPLHARAWSKLRRGRIRQALKEVFTRSTLACTGKGSWFVASIR
jgi:GT2 family glycosyltransferase